MKVYNAKFKKYFHLFVRRWRIAVSAKLRGDARLLMEPSNLQFQLKGNAMDTKPWYESATIWSGIVVVVANLAAFAGITISASDQVEIANSLAQLAGIATTLISIGGGLLTIWGRIRATQKIAIPTSPAS